MMKSLVWLSIAATAGTANAQYDLSEIPVGAQVGIYMPTNSRVRDALGDSWLSFGFAAVRPETRSGFRLTSDIAFTTRNSRGNRILMIRPSAGVVKVFGEENATTKPYFAARGGLVYADYRVDTNTGRHQGRRIQPGANAEFGVVFNRRFILSARYDWMGKFSGLQFDGFSLNATVRF